MYWIKRANRFEFQQDAFIHEHVSNKITHFLPAKPYRNLYLTMHTESG